MDPIRETARILRAVDAGEIRRALPDGLVGLSGEKLVTSLCALSGRLTPADTCYLEVGVFQGLTLLSVAAANPLLPCYGVDNFSQFDPGGRNRTIVEARRTSLGLDNAKAVDMDFEDALVRLPEHVGGRRVGVYFVDGPHDYRSQLMGLVLAMPHLASDAVIVVDDSNYAHVRQANRDFLVAFPEFLLLFESYTSCHPMNMSRGQENAARRGWWNGVNVLVRDPERRFARVEPVTERDRTVFVNDHLVHASRLATLAPRALDLAELLVGWPSPRGLARGGRSVASLFAARFGGHLKRYRAGNTGSEELPTSLFHPEI
jgi:hypothetical protein